MSASWSRGAYSLVRRTTYNELGDGAPKTLMGHSRYPRQVAHTEYLLALMRHFFYKPEHSTQWDAIAQYLLQLRRSLDSHYSAGISQRRRILRLLEMKAAENLKELVDDLEEAVGLWVQKKTNPKRSYPRAQRLKPLRKFPV